MWEEKGKKEFSSAVLGGGPGTGQRAAGHT